MTDLVSPGEIKAAADNKSIAHAISKAGGHDGYVVQGTDISQFYSALDTTAVNAFAEVTRSGLDLTLDGGEAFVSGWLCRDRTTMLTLPANSTVTVYVGFNADAILAAGESPAENENIIIDTGAGFSTDDPKLALYEIVTGSTAISSLNDVRPLGRHEASGPWRRKSDPIGTIPGPLRLESDTYQDHLTIARSSIGVWNVSPTTEYGNSLEIEYSTGTTNGTIHLTTDGQLHFEPSNTWAVDSPSQKSIYTQNTDPVGSHDVQPGDIWIRTN